MNNFEAKENWTDKKDLTHVATTPPRKTAQKFGFCTSNQMSKFWLWSNSKNEGIDLMKNKIWVERLESKRLPVSKEYQISPRLSFEQIVLNWIRQPKALYYFSAKT